MRTTIRSAVALCLAIGAASAWSAGTDELWEMTMTMKMSGMAMQPMKTKQCQAKDGNYKPQSDPKDKSCTFSDYKVAGNTVSWKMQCTGKNAMTGTGEMTRTADTMKGTMKMRSEGMDIVQVMEGKRIGTCDAAGERKATDEALADINAAQSANAKLACDNAVRATVESGGRGNGDSQFKGKGACVPNKPQMCEQMRSRVLTPGGFANYIRNRDMANSMNQTWGWGLSECGIAIEQYRAQHCQRALADKNYRFIGGFCQDEAAQLNAKECAGFGRDYTSDLARPNAAMCRALRSRATDYQDDDIKANAEADKAKATEAAKEAEKNNAKTEGAMDKLKKTFGF